MMTRALLSLTIFGLVWMSASVLQAQDDESRIPSLRVYNPQPLLVWDALEPGATYEVFVNNEKIYEGTATQVKVPTPLAHGVHTWTIISRVGDDMFASDPQFIRVEPLPPARLTAPSDGKVVSIVDGQSVELSWRTPYDGATFKVYVNDVLAGETRSDTFELTLDSGGDLTKEVSWRVEAALFGQLAVSPTATFSLQYTSEIDPNAGGRVGYWLPRRDWEILGAFAGGVPFGLSGLRYPAALSLDVSIARTLHPWTRWLEAGFSLGGMQSLGARESRATFDSLTTLSLHGFVGFSWDIDEAGRMFLKARLGAGLALMLRSVDADWMASPQSYVSLGFSSMLDVLYHVYVVEYFFVGASLGIRWHVDPEGSSWPVRLGVSAGYSF